MSDHKPGPGFYKAGDGKWYPFDQPRPNEGTLEAADTTDEILKVMGRELIRIRSSLYWIGIMVAVLVLVVLFVVFGGVVLEFEPVL